MKIETNRNHSRPLPLEPEDASSVAKPDPGVPCMITNEPTLQHEPDGLPITLFPAVCRHENRSLATTVRARGDVAVFTKWNAVVGETVRVIGNRFGSVLEAQRVIRNAAQENAL